MIQPKKKKASANRSDQNASSSDPVNSLARQADNYLKSIQHHQSAFLDWLDSISQNRVNVDRYQYKKIR